MAYEGQRMAMGHQEGPSPTVPIIILVIVGMMMSFSSYLAVDRNYIQQTVESIQSHFFLGALLIPVCIFLIVQAFGIPQVNTPGPRLSYSPVVESVMQDPSTSMFLLALIIGLLMAISFHSYIHAPWMPPPYYERRD